MRVRRWAALPCVPRPGTQAKSGHWSGAWPSSFGPGPHLLPPPPPNCIQTGIKTMLHPSANNLADCVRGWCGPVMEVTCPSGHRALLGGSKSREGTRPRQGRPAIVHIHTRSHHRRNPLWAPSVSRTRRRGQSQKMKPIKVATTLRRRLAASRFPACRHQADAPRHPRMWAR